MIELKCYHCNFPLGVEKINFRTACEKCHNYQHCCLACKNYAPGKPNDCAIPGTDPINDRKGCNFCDSFEFGTTLKKTQDQDYEDLKKKARRLLGED
jgi:hypothetical protein